MAARTGTTLGRRSDASQAARDKHTRLLSWFEQEMRRQSMNRFQMSLDEDYYDSEQWQIDEAAAVRARGQNPVVYNEVKPTIDWLIGVERRTRTDFQVINVHEDSTEADADAKNKTKLLKYLAAANRVEFRRSQAADDCFKAGLGWIEVGVSPDPEDEPIYVRAESWRNMLYDSLGVERDLADSRYVFRFRIIDLDIAQAFFPDKKDELQAACIGRDEDRYLEWWNGRPIEEMDAATPLPGKWSMYDSDAWGKNQRERVMLIEAWYKDPTTESRGGTSAIDRVRMQMRCTILTDKNIIMDVPSPYRHNKFPFVPYWCYRRKKDGAPYSPVRPVRGPQDALNKRMSKALFVMSTNQVLAEKSAFDPKVMTAEEARDEMQAPDGFVLLNEGGLKKIEINRDNDVAQGHLQLAEADRLIIRNSTGISSENLARDTNITAGVALEKKAEQGSQLTAEIFDNLLFARQLEGELSVSLIEQFYNEPKVFSINGERKKRDYVKINQPGPNGERLNDITKRKAQFVIGEQAWKQSLQRAAFESMMQLLQKLATAAPQVVLALLDVVFELSDVENKQLVLERIRSVTGQRDPDEPMTPEQEQAAQQQQAIMNKKVQAEMAQLDAQIKEAIGKGESLDASALKTRIEALYVAMQAAQVVTGMPGAAPVADELLASVGFDDRHPGAQAPPPVPRPVIPQSPNPLLGDGAAAGIETPTADGIRQQEV
jgi:hypothetical protein